MRCLPWSLLAAYAICGLFMIVESRLRQGDEAKSRDAGTADQGTTRLVGASVGAALIGTPLLALSGLGRIAVPGSVGPAVMALGLGLRVWATRALGRFYTRTLRLSGSQLVVRSGPYRWVRHPGYLGALVMWVGFGLASTSGLATVANLAMMSYVYQRRIRAEETMLQAGLGEPYRAYMHTTWRLVPGIY
jgi:protein-S-isoprenylcysteine O-methyltransferase Ste14